MIAIEDFSILFLETQSCHDISVLFVINCLSALNEKGYDKIKIYKIKLTHIKYFFPYLLLLPFLKELLKLIFIKK